jgi:hypothetical protein
MSGGLAFAGFEGAGSASDLSGAVRIVISFLSKFLRPEAGEELIGLVAQCPMRAVVPEERKSIG